MSRTAFAHAIPPKKDELRRSLRIGAQYSKDWRASRPPVRSVPQPPSLRCSRIGVSVRRADRVRPPLFDQSGVSLAGLRPMKAVVKPSLQPIDVKRARHDSASGSQVSLRNEMPLPGSYRPFQSIARWRQWADVARRISAGGKVGEVEVEHQRAVYASNSKIRAFDCIK